MNKIKLKEIEKAFLKVTSLKRTPDEVPAGWWTSADYLKSKGISQATANKHIKLLLQKNLVRSQKFLVLCEDKMLHHVPHYQLTDNNA